MNQAEGAASSPERLALIAASIVSVVSWALVVSRGAHLLHYDAKAHLVVARRVLDSNNLDVRNVVRGRLATDKPGTRVLLALDKDKPPILIDLAARRIGHPQGSE